MSGFLPPFGDPDMPEWWEELPDGSEVEFIDQINQELFDRIFPLLEKNINSSETVGISSDFTVLVLEELNKLTTKIDIETLLSVLYSIEQNLWSKHRHLQTRLKDCSDEIKQACEKYRLSVASLYTTWRKIDRDIADQSQEALASQFAAEGLENIEQSLGETYSRIRTLQFSYAGVFSIWKSCD